MGLSYLILNLEKKHFQHPHRRGDGRKLLQFTPSANSTRTAPPILPSDGIDWGDGDLHSDRRPVPLVVHALGK
jgi:hypothetical protein